MEAKEVGIKHYTYGAYLFAIGLLLTIFYFSFRAIREYEESLSWVMHTHQVLNESEKLYSQIKDAQRAQLGFLLTEDDAYLQEYSTSKKNVSRLMDTLLSYTADQEIQQKRLHELRILTDTAFAYWDQTIGYSQEQQEEEALALVIKGVGRDSAAKIGRLLDEFEQKEQQLMAMRQAEYMESRFWRNVLEFGGGFTALFILLLTFLMQRSLLKREQQLSATLEEKVMSRTEDLNKSISELTRINEELDNFVYSASHDLRAPVVNLSGLQGILKNSLEEKITPLEENCLRMMDTSIARLDRTILALTEIAKTGREELPAEELLFSAVYQDVLSDIQYLLEQNQAEIVTDFMVEHISYPYAHLKSIIYNLVSNAVKYRSPDRLPFIVVRTFQKQNKTHLIVSDNGLGLNQQQTVKLFTMFKRFHAHVEGSGVGLAMIKRMIENKGGKLWVESRPGEGSTFTVVF